jgi:hypothetical protein
VRKSSLSPAAQGTKISGPRIYTKKESDMRNREKMKRRLEEVNDWALTAGSDKARCTKAVAFHSNGVIVPLISCIL